MDLLKWNFFGHIWQPKGSLITSSNSLLFFIMMSIKRSWLQNKNEYNFHKFFWEPTFYITHFQKHFVHGLFVLGSLAKGSETSFWCTFSACFLPYKYCLLNCVSIDQVSIPDLLYFSLCFLILEMMTSQISRFIFDHLLQWLTMEERGSAVFTKIWISGEREDFFRSNENNYSWFLKRFCFEKC